MATPKKSAKPATVAVEALAYDPLLESVVPVESDDVGIITGAAVGEAEGIAALTDSVEGKKKA